MDRVAVFIPTTQGPVRVQRLVVEPHVALSNVCLNWGHTKAAISDKYSDFVSLDIVRHTRQKNYRLDLSDDINQGKSWQLGVFISHQLQHQNRLAHCEPGATHLLSDVDRIIWASGEMDVEGGVHSVFDIERKLKVSHSLFVQAQEAEIPISVLLPEEDCTDELKGRLDLLTEYHPNMEFEFIQHLDFISPNPEEPIEPDATITEEPIETLPPEKGFNPRIIAPILGLILLVGMIGAVKGIFLPPSESPLSSENEVSLQWSFADNGKCFGRRQRSEKMPVRWDDVNTLDATGRVCRVEFILGSDMPPESALEVYADRQKLDLRADQQNPGQYLLNLYLLDLSKNDRLTLHLSQNGEKIQTAEIALP